MTKNLKNLQLQKFFIYFFDQKLQFACLLYKGRPGYERSLKPLKENIQHFKTWNFLIFFYFCGSCLPPWFRIRIRIHWPDWIRIQSGSGSETLSKIDASLCWTCSFTDLVNDSLSCQLVRRARRARSSGWCGGWRGSWCGRRTERRRPGSCGPPSTPSATVPPPLRPPGSSQSTLSTSKYFAS